MQNKAGPPVNSHAERELPAMDSRVLRVFERALPLLTPAASIFTALVASVVLVGWWRGVETLVRVVSSPGFGFMIPITAIGLLLAGVALWLLSRPAEFRCAQKHPRTVMRADKRIWLGRGFAGLVLLLGLVSLLEHIFAFDLGPNFQPFRATVVELLGRSPLRPSIVAALSFTGVGLSMELLDSRSSVARRAAEWLAAMVALIALQAVIGHAYGEAGLYAPKMLVLLQPRYTPLGFHTALTTLVLALGILLARPQRGLCRFITERDTGNYLLLRLLPAAITIAIIFGGLSLLAHRAGLHGREYRVSLLVMAMIILLAVLIHSSARAIRRVDRERTRALRQLSENESMFRAIFDNAGLGIGVVDPQGHAVASNVALQDMLGYTEEELAHMTLSDVTVPDNGVLDNEMFQDLMTGKLERFRSTVRFIGRDGRMFWAQLSTSVAHDQDGAPLFGIGMVEDITERKRAEESRSRLTAILEATPDFVGITDAHGNASYVNRAGRALTGISEEDVQGLTISDFHPVWAARRVLDEGLAAAIRDGSWSGETALLRSDGEEIPVSQVILAHRGAGGEVEYFSTVMRDISERKRTELSQQFLLEASHAFSGSLEIEAVLRSIMDLVVPAWADYCVVDLIAGDGNIERVAVKHADPDRAALMEQLRHHSIGRVRGPGVAEVIRTRQPLVIPHVTDAWLESVSRSDEHLALIRKLAPRAVMCVPLFARGLVIGAITFGVTEPGRRISSFDLLVAQELSGRAGLALENARLFRQSQEATRIRDEVLRVVAHDLRNPLNTISLTAGLLREEIATTPNDEPGDRLTAIERAVQQADHLIDDLLDVARLEAGKLPLELEPTDGYSLVEEAVEAQRAWAAQRGITIECELPAHMKRIRVDRHRILQVFANLIGNALKFSPEGGHLLVRVVPENGNLAFSVSDQGPGIAEEWVPHLFDPFWQARKDTGGAGLGLPIARGIVEAHGGRIWVESEAGAGTTFHFTLPTVQADRDWNALAAD